MQPQGRGGWMGMMQQHGQPPQYGITPPMQGGYQSRPQAGGAWGAAMHGQPAQPQPMTENTMMLARALMGQRR